MPKGVKLPAFIRKAYLLIANFTPVAPTLVEIHNSKKSRLLVGSQYSEKGKSRCVHQKAALKTAQSYEGRAPSKTDVFTEGNAGATIKFSCWINSSVKVPNL